MYKYLLFIFTIILINSCDSDDDGTSGTETVIDKVEGIHVGLYENKTCAFVPAVLIEDVESQLEIVSISDSVVSGELRFNNGGASEAFNFMGRIRSDSIIGIDEFERNNEMFVGSVFLLEDSRVRMLLSNGCNFVGDLFPTDFFNEN